MADAPTLPVRGERLLEDLRTLRGFGADGAGVRRRALTREDLDARRWLCRRMAEAGLEAVMDPVATVIGRTPGAARHVLIGSHTDSVPLGGWLDGALGVLIGLEIACACVEAGGAGETGVAVVSFTDEEGRFGGLLGSRLFCGALTLPDAADSTDESGVRFADAQTAAGLSGSEILRLDPAATPAYLEAHIEQGPVLEQEGTRIGVVTGIVGIHHARLRFLGRPDHAGTTPMTWRADAAAAAYRFADRFRTRCREAWDGRCVWNLGNLNVAPGTFNVVAAEAELLIEYRSAEPQVLSALDALVHELAAEAAGATGTEWAVGETTKIAPVALDSRIGETLAESADDLKESWRWMPSGAGHDAASLAAHVPSGLLFVPSIAGRSHAPEEDSREEDIVAGLRVMARATERLIAGA